MKAGHDNYKPFEPHPDIYQYRHPKNQRDRRPDTFEPEELRQKRVASEHDPVRPGVWSEHAVDDHEDLVRVTAVKTDERVPLYRPVPTIEPVNNVTLHMFSMCWIVM